MRIIGITILTMVMLTADSYAFDTNRGHDVKGSIYSYREDDIPQVFFFPKEKARWDGSKVTMREWYMLTDLQKEKFVSEYIGELRKQCNCAVEVMGLDYMRALNVFSVYSNNKSLNTPSTKFIDRMLEGQGKQPQTAKP